LSVESQVRPTTGQTVAEKVSVNEGTHGRLMRIRGPVNKKGVRGGPEKAQEKLL